MSIEVDIEHLNQWIGNTERAEDRVAARPAAALAATLDRHDGYPKNGDRLPYLWHWLYFLSCHDASELGEDGHAKLGGFLPPVPLPRRMWAGSRFEFGQPLQIGEAIQRQSRIKSINIKQGRTGTLGFVEVEHTITGDRGGGIVEQHDIVYREPSPPGASARPTAPAPDGAGWTVTIHPDPVLLFRYSAVTFNGHRIHYDRDYCRRVEGYDGLVVHGPLIATLLLEHAARQYPVLNLSRFSFRAVSPTLDTRPFQVSGARDGDQLKLWASSMDGALAMQAEAQCA